jgi:uncharacterized protein YgiM (DUF1202 family)
MNRIITITTFLLLTFQVFGQDYKYVNTETLNIREGAGKEYNVVGQVNKGDKVNSLSESGSWTQIETETGLTGFVATKYLSSTADEPKSSDKKDSSWVSILVVLGIIGYGLYKIKNFFSGLFGGSSSNSSSHRTPSREPILKWYYCAGCRTTIKQASTPRNSNSCINRDFHKWQELGKVGDKNYQCSKCGTTIQTTDTPKNYNSCVNRDFHKWNKF